MGDAGLAGETLQPVRMGGGEHYPTTASSTAAPPKRPAPTAPGPRLVDKTRLAPPPSACITDKVMAPSSAAETRKSRMETQSTGAGILTPDTNSSVTASSATGQHGKRSSGEDGELTGRGRYRLNGG